MGDPRTLEVRRKSVIAGRLLGVVQLPANPESVALARGFVRRMLGAGHPVVDEVTLLVSELFTNSVVHSDSRHGGSVIVAVADCFQCIHVDVMDAGGKSFPNVKREPMAEGGRGLSLVDDLSIRWGIANDADGRTVWFEVGYKWGALADDGSAVKETARLAARVVATSLALEESSHSLKPDG
ncbi:ATP-binding protein [Sphaerisporangium album]|uniref:ATP-binding protein n=1 Tax=Sphaerisporangium album TaxID=509200 RepID=A0A367EQ31_9ACTN|nr:ATP-binding protein [Sphaerisporangium album]RCG20083.1 ATP-binding protein [Sphaerisporangium album]